MKKPIIATLLIIAILLIVAHLEWRFAPAEEHMRSAYLRPCDATVSDGEHSHNMPDPRCYFFKDHR